ncbi:hypothetical protein HOW07_09510 [Plantibacter sp. MCCC 1A11337]|uniref:hypothetical protein n=1 Tax=Plantibacter sp. MCCC 1A11337 TaxID=2736644 RepID=UPI0015817ABB|nr:hypothetical protein [Plantibacter sp. MCCC 1A11337]NUJ88245.1 hypothetical protein [Plantibacter sp. MCCC 1A11337]
MAVRRSGRDAYYTFREFAPRVRLFQDDLAGLIEMLEDRGAQPRLMAGEDVAMDSAADVVSLSGKELRELRIKTRSPRFTIELTSARTLVSSIDDDSHVSSLGNDIVAFLRRHAANPWERVAVEANKIPRALALLSALAFLVPTVLIVSVGAPVWSLVLTVSPLLGSAGSSLTAYSGTWITRKTRAETYVSRAERGWAAVRYVSTAVAGVVIGSVVTDLLP